MKHCSLVSCRHKKAYMQEIKLENQKGLLRQQSHASSQTYRVWAFQCSFIMFTFKTIGKVNSQNNQLHWQHTSIQAANLNLPHHYLKVLPYFLIKANQYNESSPKTIRVYISVPMANVQLRLVRVWPHPSLPWTAPSPAETRSSPNPSYT